MKIGLDKTLDEQAQDIIEILIVLKEASRRFMSTCKKTALSLRLYTQTRVRRD